MAYTIEGKDYARLAERKFAVGKSMNSFQDRDLQLPFIQHSVRNLYSDSFGLIHFRADIKREVNILGITDTEHASLHFQLHGTSSARFRGIKGEQPLSPGECNLYFAEEFKTDLLFKEDKNFEYLAITLKRNYLLALLEQYGHPLPRLEKLLNTGAPFALSGKALPVKGVTNSAIQTLLDFPVADDLAGMFLTGKIMEILALQLSEEHRSDLNCHYSYIPKGRITEVYEFICHHFLDIHSLEDLSDLFPMTPLQIKRGLRSKYNTSLYELLFRLRMQHALYLLRNSDMNVNEVAWEIGYSNATNFIQAFKRTFQTTPKRTKTL